MSSFLGRLVIIGALAAGVYSVFRRDILRVGKFLKKPTENFIADIKKELDTNTATKVGAESSTLGASEGTAGASGTTLNTSTPKVPEKADFPSTPENSTQTTEKKQELK